MTGARRRHLPNPDGELMVKASSRISAQQQSFTDCNVLPTGYPVTKQPVSADGYESPHAPQLQWCVWLTISTKAGNICTVVLRLARTSPMGAGCARSAA